MPTLMRAGRLVLAAFLVVLGASSLLTGARGIDVRGLERQHAASPDIWRVLPADRLPANDLVSAVVVDIDHDGDFDLLALSEEDGVIALVNDGLGRFSRTVPSVPPLLSASTTWSLPGSGPLGLVAPTRSVGDDRTVEARPSIRPPPARVSGVIVDTCVSHPTEGGRRTSPRGPPFAFA